MTDIVDQSWDDRLREKEAFKKITHAFNRQGTDYESAEAIGAVRDNFYRQFFALSAHIHSWLVNERYLKIKESSLPEIRQEIGRVLEAYGIKTTRRSEVVAAIVERCNRFEESIITPAEVNRLLPAALID